MPGWGSLEVKFFFHNDMISWAAGIDTDFFLDDLTLSSSGLGALKAEHIDTWSPDSAVGEFLNNTLHKDVEPLRDQDSELLDAMAEPCVPGFCKHNPNSLWEPTTLFVKGLQKEFTEKSILTSSLILLSSEAYPVTVYFFVGIILKKPLLQTVAMAKVEGDRVSFELSNGRPIFSTTYHVISNFLHCTSRELTEISVEHWACTYRLENNKALVVTADRLSTSFTISTTKKRSTATRKPAVKLPFGLSSLDVKKRKTQRAQHDPASKKRQRGIPHEVPAASSAASSMPLASESVLSQALAFSDRDSDSDVISQAAAEETSASSTDEDADAVDQSDPVVPISQTARKEEIETKRVEQELESAYQAQESLAEEVRSGKSFFSKKLGLAGGSLAASGRSKCRACGKLIPKDSVRFEWYWNRLRPNSWIHPHCLVDISQQNNLLQDTKRVLEGLVSASASSRDRAESSVQQEAAQILACISDVP